MATVAATRNWERTFESWSSPPSVTEREKCENAERMIKKAIAANEKLQDKNIRVFVQGSYRHRTNVRQESDVDVCVCLKETFSTEYDDGLSDADLGYSTATYEVDEFKNDVEKALRTYFGSSVVTRGKKAFDVHANTYRVDADVVPTLEHRWHYKYEGRTWTITGTALYPDGGLRTINWPDQTYDNGVSKQGETGQRYKKVVRILKRLRNEMADQEVQAARTMPSFLIDCMVWNVPDDHFNHDTFHADVRAVLAYLFNNTRPSEDCSQWTEVNGIKFLFHMSQPWTKETAHAFISAAWDYIGFE